MNVGFRIFTKINRPDPKFLESFRDIPVANIADQMGRFTCVDAEIKPYNEHKLLGTAFTVKVPPGDNLMFHKALELAIPGDIIAVDGEGSEAHSLCGGLMFNYAVNKKLGGFLINGYIRDVEDARICGIPIYARGVQPKGPYKNGPGEIGVPVSIGGIVVCPGDILVSDQDGVVCIRQIDAEEILKKAGKRKITEENIIELIQKGKYSKPWVDNILKEKGCEIINKYWFEK